MNILIITGKFGMGHIIASNAIKQEIQESFPYANIEIIDFIDALAPHAKKAFYRSYNTVVKNFPELYNMAIKAANKTDAVPLRHIISKKFNEVVSGFSPDLIITTAPVSSKYLTDYKIKIKDVPMFTYITDIYCHRQWLSPGTDAYFVGAEKMKSFLINKGVSENNIYVSGIPVRNIFKSDEANKDYNRGTKRVLIMGGGLGMISGSDDFLSKLNSSDNIITTVIAGKNKKLLDELKEKYKNIEVLGYIENVSPYMRNADVIISKPGGMTLFESIYCTTPMFVIKPELVQEIHNARYIAEEGIGKVIWDDECDIYDELNKMLCDQSAYEMMILKLRQINDNRKLKNINLAIAQHTIYS